MLIPLLILVIAVGLLVMRVAPQLSLTTSVLGIVVVGYVLGHDFWHANIGPIPLTIDRIFLIGMASLMAWRWWNHQLPTTTPIGVDWAIAGVLAILVISFFTHKGGSGDMPDSPFFRILVSYITPSFLYLALRHEKMGKQQINQILAVFTGLGCYLAITALLETAEVWPLVFPKYIADPELGLHYGRARGPGLNSVSLGVYLSVCGAASWLWMGSLNNRWKPFLLSAIGLMCLGVLLTFTRSTWLGLAGAMAVLATFHFPKPHRLRVFIGIGMLGILFLVVGKDALIALQREDAAASESAHSVQQRTAFAYVSYEMFKDHPLWGVGYGRFYDKKLPYLTDRRQSFELESLRGLHHHNTFLSLLTETGLLGLSAYLAVLAGLGNIGIKLANSDAFDKTQQQLGVFLLAVLMIYLPSALFHDLTLVHSNQWVLLVAGGAAAGCWVNRQSQATYEPLRRKITHDAFATSTFYRSYQTRLRTSP